MKIVDVIPQVDDTMRFVLRCRRGDVCVDVDDGCMTATRPLGSDASPADERRAVAMVARALED